MNAKQYSRFVELAWSDMETKIKRCKEEFHFGKYKRWNYDFDEGVFLLSGGGRESVEGIPHAVGTIAKKSGTWLWSWANPGIPSKVSHCMGKVHSFGVRHKLKELTKAKWRADEQDGWRMTAITAHILDCEGVYRCPDKDGYMFLVLKGIRKTPAQSKAKGRRA